AKGPGDYRGARAEAGVGGAEGAGLPPAGGAAGLFAGRGYPGGMVLGTGGLAGPLRSAGLEVVPPVRGQAADAVLAGWYRQFSMDALEAACDAVWQGARLYSCSQSVFFATAEGRALGTSRAITAMIRSITGCRVEIAGRPSQHALGTAARQLGLRRRDLAVVGDDPELEMPMARRGGALAVAVGTGVGTARAFAGLPGARRPPLFLPGGSGLLDLYTDRLPASRPRKPPPAGLGRGSRGRPRAGSGTLARLAGKGSVFVHDDAADVLAVHQVLVALPDVIQPVLAGDKLIQLEHAGPVHVDH